MALNDLKNYVLGRAECEYRPAVGQTITRHFTRLGHTYRNDPNVAAGIDGFIRAMSSEDLKKWTRQVYKQSRSGIRYPEQDFLLSEPVTEVTDAHRKMPHLPLLSPDADLLAALLRRNQFLEEQNAWLSAVPQMVHQSAVQVPVPTGSGPEVPVVQFQQAKAAGAANEMEVDECLLIDWDGFLFSDLPLPP
jgi:hypothetical protein